MISCAVAKGNTNSPISNFNCLQEDIPFLPVNYFNYEVSDIDINFTTLEPINIKENSIINKMIFTGITDGTTHISVSNIKIYGTNDNNDDLGFIEYNKENFSSYKEDTFGILSPIDKKYYVEEYSFIRGMKLNIENIIDEEMNNIQQQLNGNKISKIVVTFKFNKNGGEQEPKDITFNIENKIEKEHSVNHFFIDGFVPNGSIAFIMDTSEVYMFDEENDMWLKI